MSSRQYLAEAARYCLEFDENSEMSPRSVASDHLQAHDDGRLDPRPLVASVSVRYQPAP
jgi:hypothetical protein